MEIRRVVVRRGWKESEKEGLGMKETNVGGWDERTGREAKREKEGSNGDVYDEL